MKLWKRHEVGLLLTIFVVILLTSWLDSGHNYWKNPTGSAVNVIRQTSLMGIYVLGASVVIISGGIDLSVGSVIAICGTSFGLILHTLAPEELRSGTQISYPILLFAILATLLLGLAIGSLHAWLITIIGLPPFVATLATLVGLRSFARIMLDEYVRRTQIDFADPLLRTLADVRVTSTIYAVLAIAIYIVMSKTVLGRHLYALGGNEQATRLSGINTDRLKWFAYCLSGLLSAVAGILYTQEATAAVPLTLGRGYELNAIAGAVVGGCSLQGGIGTISGAFLGTLFLRLVSDAISLVVKTGADLYEGIIMGAVVVVAVAANQRQALSSRLLGGALGIVILIVLSGMIGLFGSIVVPKLLAPREVPALTTGLSCAGIALICGFAIRWMQRRA